MYHCLIKQNGSGSHIGVLVMSWKNNSSHMERRNVSRMKNENGKLIVEASLLMGML